MGKRSRIVQYVVAAAVSLASMTLGVISAWPTPVIAKFHANETGTYISDKDISWMLAMSSPGFIAGSVATRYISDRYGRRTTILSSAIPMSLGTILVVFSLKPWILYKARFLWGWGTGMIGTVVSMYLAEIADKDLRGTLSVGTRFMFNFGTLLAISVGPFLSYHIFNISILVLPLIYFLACCWIPESPYYYLKEGRVEEARRVLTKLRSYKDSKAVEDELQVMKSSVSSEMQRDSSVKELLIGEQYRKAVIISAGLKLTQIMTGVMTVQQYLGRIMQDTKTDIKLTTVFIIFGAVRFLIGIMSSILVDRVGRRTLLIFSFFGTAVCHIMVGGYFFCQEVLKIDQTVLTPYGYVTFLGILGSSIVSTLGYTSIIFVIFGEIFPMNIKAVAMSSISIYGGILGFIIAKGYQELKDLIGMCGVFGIFALVAIIGAVFTIGFVPETKGKSLREIQIMLQGDIYNDTEEVTSNNDKNTELQELKRESSRL
ncbi:unnamed protein product [Diatraea saccharalis]|uniref:Major facilitator superfamily (MFS) profile domain-containing protein n=1 Tax=Diatraea saccharalis TaxID=40085 RepID=A0A9N9QZ49_9NEOP|nr:unnamed protein product [Diatraea saccharalis]